MRIIPTTQGLTLVEVLVALTILGTILSFGMIVELNVFQIDTLEAEQATIITALQKARSRSMSNTSATAHGVCYLDPNYIIFRDSPGTRCEEDTPTNELIPANREIASHPSSTFPVVVFKQLSGNAENNTIYLTDGITSKDITINNQGAINW